WCLNQQAALTFSAAYPGRVHVVRFEDVVADPVGVLGRFLEAVGVGRCDTLACPTWNGRPLDQVYPWGTIRTPTPEANRATADELSDGEQEEVRVGTGPYLDVFGYGSFLASGRRAA